MPSNVTHVHPSGVRKVIYHIGKNCSSVDGQWADMSNRPSAGSAAQHRRLPILRDQTWLCSVPDRHVTPYAAALLAAVAALGREAGEAGRRTRFRQQREDSAGR